MTEDAPADDVLLFEVDTPLGFRVRVTRSYWELIVTIKHLAMRGHEGAFNQGRHLPVVSS